MGVVGGRGAAAKGGEGEGRAGDCDGQGNGRELQYAAGQGGRSLEFERSGVQCMASVDTQCGVVIFANGISTEISIHNMLSFCPIHDTLLSTYSFL